MKKIFSSWISGVDYDAKASELTVEYKSGARTVYRDVPQPVAEQVLSAPSVGEALHRFVRGRFDHASNTGG